MWRKHREGYAARHDTALRLLARIGGAAVGFDLDGARHSRLRALQPSPQASRRVPALRVSGIMQRWLCRTSKPPRRAAGAGLLLSDRSRASPRAADPTGRAPR